MQEETVLQVPQSFAATALIDADEYESLYRQSIDHPEKFWAEQGRRIDWFKEWDSVKETDFKTASINWYAGGKLNVSHNCLDRHLEQGRKDKTAIIWEGDEPTESKRISYGELHEEVCKFANVLKNRGVRKGDRVLLYMPMVPELAVACLACTRIGAIHSVVFGGFSPTAIRSRIADCAPVLLVTSNEALRGKKVIPMKHNCDEALKEGTSVETTIVLKRTETEVPMLTGRDFDWDEEMAKADADCPPEHMDAEDPLFILYTSGSTGKPKGVMHTTGGYLVYASLTHRYVFDLKEDDVYWCTADVGWITGHSYILYGPLANGATTLMFEGVPNYPDFGRFWDVVDKHGVTIFYTAPTAIRAIAKEGDEHVRKRDLSTLRLLGTVGEPINPEAWNWYHKVVGKSRCPIVDTWWQTETGGILITPLPGATPLKPGSATRPFFGVRPVILNAEGQELEGESQGNLCIKDSWPGQMRSVYGDHERFRMTYFVQYPGYYFTGDGARRDKDGYYWITGRVDDVINVSGHRLGTAEIESALVLHEKVAEAAVIGIPHEIKGQTLYAYVTLNSGTTPGDELKKELVSLVRREIGPIAAPEAIQWTQGLPKTRSGKIMRRILRKISHYEEDSIGDTSTLADPSVVDELIKNRIKVG